MDILAIICLLLLFIIAVLIIINDFKRISMLREEVKRLEVSHENMEKIYLRFKIKDVYYVIGSILLIILYFIELFY
ncbi:hypothetical protein SAMN05444972_11184 [Marininema halotolerans]|uniref:Uncharacterized protein n=1 Tax=Marininema halotolerans TaxID=1155944 RepID=A0A1I6TUL0_9BACL|nr:hypothetical protein SAMN05444972_11184 [Marininema halotolerans]